MYFAPGVAWVALALGAGCTSPWERYEDSLYTSLKVPGPEAYARHAELLGEVVEEAEAARRTPPPGILAEYGFYLARAGRTAESKKYFAAEKQAYPESATFVESLERTVEGHRAFTTPAEAKP